MSAEEISDRLVSVWSWRRRKETWYRTGKCDKVASNSKVDRQGRHRSRPSQSSARWNIFTESFPFKVVVFNPWVMSSTELLAYLILTLQFITVADYS